MHLEQNISIHRLDGNDAHPETVESEELVNFPTADDVDIDGSNSDDEEGTTSP